MTLTAPGLAAPAQPVTVAAHPGTSHVGAGRLAAERPEGRARVLVRSFGIGVSHGVLAVVLLLAAVTILVPRFTGSVPLSVLSGSMEPTLPVGSLVVVRPVEAADVRIGDMVTYLPNPDDPTAITHRVTGITHRTGGGLTFTMQGDANDAPDLPVHDHQVRARVWYVVHHLGHLNSAVNVDDRHLGVYVVAGGFFVWAVDLWRRTWRDRRAGAGAGASGHDERSLGHAAQQGPVRHP